MNNPVFLWAHDYSRPPIGKGVAVSTDGSLAVKVQFVSKDIDPFAEQIYQLYKSGIMSTVSVGFMPYKVDNLTENDMKQRPELKYGRRISAELLELSAVPVPANPNALASREMAEVMAKGFHVDNDLAKAKMEELLKKVGEDLAAIKAAL
jgi:HK97 family phage prohead protease